MESSHFAQDDRDLLITIKTQLDRAVTDIKDMNAKFDMRESKYAMRTELHDIEKRMNDHEQRLRGTERIAFGAISILTAFQVYFGFFK